MHCIRNGNGGDNKQEIANALMPSTFHVLKNWPAGKGKQKFKARASSQECDWLFFSTATNGQHEIETQ